MSMYKTGEIYKVMEDFEKIASGRLDREKDRTWWQKSQWYENGETNAMFKMFLHGYMDGKLSERLGLY